MLNNHSKIHICDKVDKTMATQMRFPPHCTVTSILLLLVFCSQSTACFIASFIIKSRPIHFYAKVHNLLWSCRRTAGAVTTVCCFLPCHCAGAKLQPLGSLVAESHCREREGVGRVSRVSRLDTFTAKREKILSLHFCWFFYLFVCVFSD